MGPDRFCAWVREQEQLSSPTPPSGTHTSRCSPRACAPTTCCAVAGHVAHHPQLFSLSVGAARRSTWPCASVRRPVAAPGRAARGDSQLLFADAAARPQRRGLHDYPTVVASAFVEGGRRRGHRHIPHLRFTQRLSSRCGPPSKQCARRGEGGRSRDLLHGRPLDPRREAYTLDYYLGWPRRSTMPARTCWPSRTWPDCSAARPPARSSARCASARHAGAFAHARHVGRRSPACSPRRSGRRRRRCGRRLDGRPHVAAVDLGAGLGDGHPARDPGCRWPRSTRWSRTGRRCARCTRRSSPGCRAAGRGLRARDPGGQYSNLREQASRSASATSSSGSRTGTPPSTRCSATSSR